MQIHKKDVRLHAVPTTSLKISGEYDDALR